MAPRITTARVLGAGAAAGALASAVVVQRRHLRRIEHDPRYIELSRPLDGETLPVRSRDGTRLNVQAFPGTGAPAESELAAPGTTFVLIHGWTERLEFWRPVIQLLTAAGMRALAYDLRGHGDSGRATDDDYGLERFGEDVEAVLEAAVSDGERAVVVGHSLGAMSIAAWAENHPVRRRARATALINTGLGDLLTGHMLLGELAARFNNQTVGRLLLGSRAPLPAFSSPIAHAAIRHAAFGPSAGSAEVAFFERMLLSCSPDVRAACGLAMSDMDLQDAVARLDVPTLVVVGDRDRLTPSSHARRIAAALPEPAGLVELPETGHMSPLERPRELTDLLLELAAQTAEDRATA